MRLHAFISSCGVCSRRNAEKLIATGSVIVNQKPVFRVIDVEPNKDVVVVNGKLVTPVPFCYFALHKPEKYLCSNRKQDTRKIVSDLLTESHKKHLNTVGRLDYYSTGLIIITNDGHSANKLLNPYSNVEKQYIVECTIDIPRNAFVQYLKVNQIPDNPYTIKSFKILSPRIVSIVLTEGKNREIRKIMAACDLEIKKLHRVRIGLIKLGALRSGKYRPLTTNEIDYIGAL